MLSYDYRGPASRTALAEVAFPFRNPGAEAPPNGDYSQMNTDQLTVLMIDDIPANAEMCLQTLKQAGYSVQMDVCWKKEDFAKKIGVSDYDIILTACDLTNWNGMESVEIMRVLGKNIPVVMVTESLGDERAVACIRRGAADYVLKDRLERLPFVVHRAIKEHSYYEKSNLPAAALANLGEGVLIAEAATEFSSATIAFVNPNFMKSVGYNAQHLIGKPLSIFRANGAGANPFVDCAAKLRESGGDAVEFVLVRRDGSRYDAEWQLSSIHDPSGRISHYVVVNRDISDRKRSMAELARSNAELVSLSDGLQETAFRAESESRAKSAFLAYISHELRTPLNVIVGMADLLSEAKLPASQAKYIEVFQRAGEELLVQVNQLLDLSRIESGKLELEHTDFDLNAVLARTTELFRVPAQTKGLNLSFRVTQETPTRLVGDPHQLQQVLTNLIGNAIKFTHKGSVAVEAKLSEVAPHLGLTIQFTVADSGVGIADDKQAVVFENFIQADSSFPRLYGGTGLGLGICRALVELMGGTIMVDSAIGVGSTFRFTANFGRQTESLLAGYLRLGYKNRDQAQDGVINIMTKSAADTRGALITAGGGSGAHGPFAPAIATASIKFWSWSTTASLSQTSNSA